jgi:hypothetical protein
LRRYGSNIRATLRHAHLGVALNRTNRANAIGTQSAELSVVVANAKLKLPPPQIIFCAATPAPGLRPLVWVDAP